MAKNLKLNIKNTQIAQAINLGGIKDKLAKKKAEEQPPVKAPASKSVPKAEHDELAKEGKEEQAPRIKARSKSAFAEPQAAKHASAESMHEKKGSEDHHIEHPLAKELAEHKENYKTSEELRRNIFGDPNEEVEEKPAVEAKALLKPIEEKEIKPKETVEHPIPAAVEEPVSAPVIEEQVVTPQVQAKPPAPTPPPAAPKEAPVKLGPTGRHMRDLIPPKPAPKPQSTTGRPPYPNRGAQGPRPPAQNQQERSDKPKPKPRTSEDTVPKVVEEDTDAKKGLKSTKFKDFKDIKPVKREPQRSFDARDRQGLRDSEEDQVWRRRKNRGHKVQIEDTTIRPTSLKVRVPISVKDLASEMKLKASQLIAKLFMQGIVLTLNDLLDDETTIALLGQEFGCDIQLDTTEEERIRITGKSIREEIAESDPSELVIRPPVVAFMGHVDHGKTSLIDAIRKSNRTAQEAGAITQHIGAFRCSTPVGDIAILDTPGHEAFSAMRARGADVTDIVVLVIAGDEGIRQQTVEAIQHAKAAKVTIVVALNKCDKPNFNAENIYRQLSEHELLPESWGGQTITVNCSAHTGEGIQTLLEMLALQAEVLELRANPHSRARGTVVESEMHKGMGAVATILVQNGTLRRGDSLVFDTFWGRVKTMHNEFGKELETAGPSTPVEITGLSGLPEAGQEFIVVKSEKEAREIAEARQVGQRQTNLQARKVSMENLFQQAADGSVKKILNVILRADVQGSLEALRAVLMKIQSNKVELNVIFTGVGEVSESDVQLASASKALIVGFHTQIESHAEQLVKELGIQVRMHDIIYHAVDDVKAIMAGMLEKIAIETDKGKTEVKALFKSSKVGVIAGCQVIEGVISRNHHIRVRRGKNIVGKSTISSLKREKEDVREVQKGMECGVLLSSYNELEVGDILESYEVTYITQEL